MILFSFDDRFDSSVYGIWWCFWLANQDHLIFFVGDRGLDRRAPVHGPRDRGLRP